MPGNTSKTVGTKRFQPAEPHKSKTHAISVARAAARGMTIPKIFAWGAAAALNRMGGETILGFESCGQLLLLTRPR